MYSNMGTRPGGVQQPFNSQPDPFGGAFSGAGAGLIRSGLGAYGEKILGSSSEYVQSNISRGHWTRISEPVGGRLSYKPPIQDINAPDLYIPFMAFFTYLVVAGLILGLRGNFSPETLNWLFMKGLVGWFLQVLVLKLGLLSLSSGEAPFLDIVAYAGYAFVGISLSILSKMMWNYSYYILMPWTCLCMGIFLLKTMKRVLYAEVRSYDSSRHHYLLLIMVVAQFPLFIWLGNISLHWLF